ncbi:MAG: hypothetical protein KID07_08865 [Firmicutes bacterium]|nr:hypothetical protein [Bacillota bacterium]
MSVIHKKSNGGASTEIEKEVREVKAAGEQTAALLALSFKAQIVQDRAAGTNVISDAAILQSAEVIEYDEYADNHAYNTVGEIIKHNGRYYEIKAAHTSNAAAYPVETTFAYYRLIELSQRFFPSFLPYALSCSAISLLFVTGTRTRKAM